MTLFKSISGIIIDITLKTKIIIIDITLKTKIILIWRLIFSTLVIGKGVFGIKYVTTKVDIYI